MRIQMILFVIIAMAISGCKVDSTVSVETNSSFSGSIVPLYTYPTDSSWDTLVQTKHLLETIAIINPNNGPIDCNISDDYRQGIEKLQNSSIKVIGYVYTSYGARPIDDVKADILRYNECFSTLDGIFLDETNASEESSQYYNEVYRFVKDANSSKKVVLNPGVYPDEKIFLSSDMTIIYENSGENYDQLIPPSYTNKYPSDRFALLGYNVQKTAINAEKLKTLASMGVGYVYLTDDGVGADDPWDSLSSYFHFLLELLLTQ